jgi:hypothetical protein
LAEAAGRRRGKASGLPAEVSWRPRPEFRRLAPEAARLAPEAPRLAAEASGLAREPGRLPLEPGRLAKSPRRVALAAELRVAGTASEYGTAVRLTGVFLATVSQRLVHEAVARH